nr:MAG TPA: hypothetical protein [Caudoviricetes sp.]
MSTFSTNIFLVPDIITSMRTSTLRTLISTISHVIFSFLHNVLVLRLNYVKAFL